MRFPLSGTLLSAFAVILLVSFSHIWRENGLYWRAGLIAVLMKSISPSAVIFGPMTGIMLEALLMESFVFLFGKNLLGYLVGGGMTVFSALLHKIITLLIIYGYNLVRLTVYLYQYALEKLKIQERNLNPWLIIGLFISLYLIMGALASFIGYFFGKKARQTQGKVFLNPPGLSSSGFSFSSGYSIIWLIFHLVLLSVQLWIVAHWPFSVATGIVVIYVMVCLWRYKRAVRHLKKPFFWIQLIVITLLAAVVWNGLQKGNIFYREGLVIGLRMSLRAVLVMVSFSAVSVEFRNPFVRTILFKRGFAQLYLSVSLAFSFLPFLMEEFSRPQDIIRRTGSVITRMLASAESLLETFVRSMERHPVIYLVTGPVGSGKPTFLKSLSEELKARGIKPSGFFAEGFMKNGEKKGYTLVSLADGESKPFGYAGKKKRRINTGKFSFYPETIRWGEDILWESLMDGSDVLVIDEIGSLELKGQGWSRIIDRLLREKKIPYIWAVRSRLVDAVQAAWNFKATGIIDINKVSPAALAEELVDKYADR